MLSFPASRQCKTSTLKRFNIFSFSRLNVNFNFSFRLLCKYRLFALFQFLNVSTTAVPSLSSRRHEEISSTAPVISPFLRATEATNPVGPPPIIVDNTFGRDVQLAGVCSMVRVIVRKYKIPYVIFKMIFEPGNVMK